MKKMDITKWQHDHSFGQDTKQQGESRTLIVIVITAVMMVVEIGSGVAFGSMALLADGMHMASHALALGINYFAYIYARRHAHDPRFSFGTGKVNALGGFSGAILLALFALMMAWESVDRLIHPTEIAFNSAIFVAILGLVVNGASVFILGDNHHHDHGHSHEHSHEHDTGHSHEAHSEHHHQGHHHPHQHHDHNLRSAYLHVLADALTSVTAIIALLAAKYFGWIWMDPLMGIVGSLLVAKWSVGLLKQTSGTLLDHQAPEEVLAEVEQSIQKLGAPRIIDLHVWRISPNHFSVILSILPASALTADAVRATLDREQFPHVTVEILSNEG